MVTVMACAVLTACGNDDTVTPTLTYEEALAQYLALLDQSSVYADDFTATNDKAMLLLPGLMDSSLYAIDEENEDGSPKIYWGMDSVASAASLLTNIATVASANADGIPTKKLRAGTMDDITPYDAFGFFGEVYQLCEDRYGDEYDVLCWQYDWRTHLDGVAQQLDKFITDNEYESVVIIGHSMGCNVTSRYLALGEEQRAKVEKFIAFGGPFLGAIDANVMAWDRTSSVTSGMASFTSMLEMTDFSMKTATQQLACGQHLMGIDAFNSLPFFTEGQTYFSLDGQYKTHAEYYEYLNANYDWTKGTDGNTKFIIDTFDDFEAALFVDGVHVSKLVDTEYVAAVGVNTVISFNVDSATRRINSVRTTEQGDMLVSLYSATCGITWEGDNVPSNVTLVTGCNHLTMLSAENLAPILDKFDG